MAIFVPVLVIILQRLHWQPSLLLIQIYVNIQTLEQSATISLKIELENKSAN